MDFLSSRVGMLKGVGLRNVLQCNCGSCKESVEHVHLSVHHMIPRDQFFGLYETNS